jgi:hypothetical protein
VEVALRKLGHRSVRLHDASLLTGIVVLGPGGYTQLRACLTDSLHTRVGASPIYHTLEDTRHLVWLADAAREASPPGRHIVIMAAEDIPSVFIRAAPEITRHLASKLAVSLRAARPNASGCWNPPSATERRRITDDDCPGALPAPQHRAQPHP